MGNVRIADAQGRKVRQKHLELSKLEIDVYKVVDIEKERVRKAASKAKVPVPEEAKEVTEVKAPTSPCQMSEVCGTTGGKPEKECSQFGLPALGKDDFNQKVASRSAALTLVKAGTCFTVLRCAEKGTHLKTISGKDI